MGPFVVVQALWLFLPAYMANMAPIFAMRLFPNWKARIDGGRAGHDGRPLFGEGKTWRGLLAGTLAGGASAWAQSNVRHTGYDLTDFGHTDAGGPSAPILLGMSIGLGALLGDLVKSYFKRRTGRAGGKPWVPFDQLDFVVGGSVLAALASTALVAMGAVSTDWFSQELLGSNWPRLLVLFVLTPGLHFLVNVIGYKMKLKSVPW